MDQIELLRSLQNLLAAADVSVGSLHERIDAVLAAAGSVLEADGTALLMVDDQDELRLVGASDERARLLEEAQMRLGCGPALDAMTTREPLPVADLSESRTYRALAAILVPAGVRAVLAVPVVVRDTDVGALNLYRSHSYEWPGEDVRAARAYAALMSLLFRVAFEAGYQQPVVLGVQRLVADVRREPSAGASPQDDVQIGGDEPHAH